MSKLFTGSLDVTKIIKDKLHKGEKGTYLNVVIWLNDEEDQYGNIMSVQQKTDKEEPAIYLGNCKEYKKPEDKVNTGLPEEEPDDLPF